MSAPKDAVREHLATLAAAGHRSAARRSRRASPCLNVVRESTAGRGGPDRVRRRSIRRARPSALLADGRLTGLRVVSARRRRTATSSAVSARCAGRCSRSPTASRSTPLWVGGDAADTPGCASRRSDARSAPRRRASIRCALAGGAGHAARQAGGVRDAARPRAPPGAATRRPSASISGAASSPIIASARRSGAGSRVPPCSARRRARADGGELRARRAPARRRGATPSAARSARSSRRRCPVSAPSSTRRRSCRARSPRSRSSGGSSASLAPVGAARDRLSAGAHGRGAERRAARHRGAVARRRDPAPPRLHARPTRASRP